MIHYYDSKLKELKDKEKETGKIGNIYLWIKLCSFASGVIFLYFSYSDYSISRVILTVLSFAVYAVVLYLDSNCQKNLDEYRRTIKVCEREISALNRDFTPFDDGRDYTDTSHEYSYDLDIFGKDSLFNRINRTVTLIGRDRLAYKLTHLFQDKAGITRAGQAIDELSLLVEWRMRFMSHQYIDKDLSSFEQLINRIKTESRFIFSPLPYIIVSFTILLLVLSICGVTPWGLFVIMFVFNILITALFNRTTTVANINIENMYKEFSGYTKILNDVSGVEFKSQHLKEQREKLFAGEVNSLGSFRKLARILNLFDQRSSAVIYILLNGTMLFDLFLIRSFVRWNNESSPYISVWLDCIAELDAMVSMANYAYNNPDNVSAEILDDDSEHIIQAEEIYHPFLSGIKAVTNDFILNKKNIAIITGANMAGKSTFLRTIGITYIMACNGMPVCARSFRFSIVTLFSSMRTSDNLSKDISYFNAELIRLKSLVEHLKTSRYTLIILDEILKGTNSKDKLKGSIIFLNEISKYNMSALIATHDLELARLEEEDDKLYSNYRFEIELSDEIKYTYKIEKGVAQNLNASYLLSNMLGIGC